MESKVYLIIATLCLVLSLLSCSSLAFPDGFAGSITGPGGVPMAGVAVSNGTEVTLTASDGSFSLPGRKSSRFVYLSVPSGYRADPFYIAVGASGENYDFALTSHKASEKGGSPFIHLTDTETILDGPWIDEIERYVAVNETAFLIHTGDICYKDGMDFHSENLNSGTLGIPVYYSIGNHDLVDGEYGEKYYEDRFGPAYYSFNSGGVHYVVLPMLYGDYRPSYRQRQIARWLKNDLSMIDKTTPLVIFSHDYYTLGDEFSYKGLNLKDYNLLGWGFGHWHINYVRKDGDDRVTSWTVTPPKGGIDHSPGILSLVSVDKSVLQEHRYPYWNQKVFSPAEGVVMAYDTARRVRYVEFSPHDSGEVFALEKTGTFTWRIAGDSVPPWKGIVSVRFDGDRIKQIAVTPGESSLNLLTSTGSRIFMTSPVIGENMIYSASFDDTGKGEHYIYGIDKSKGRILWRYKTLRSVRNDIVLYDGLIGAADGDSNIYILNGSDGSLKYFYPTEMDELGQNMTGSLVSEGILYGGFAKALKAIDMRSGRILWRNDSWTGGEGTVSSLALSGDLLLAGANWRALYGHNPLTGKLLWKNSEVRFQSSTPVFTEEGILNINGDSIFLLDRADGEVLKELKTPYGFQVGGRPLLYREVLIFPTSHDGVTAWNLETGKELWNFRTGESLVYTAPYSWPGEGPVSTVETSPIMINDLLFFGASDGNIYGLNPATGEMVRKIELGIPLLADLAMEGDSIYAADFDGNIWRIDI